MIDGLLELLRSRIIQTSRSLMMVVDGRSAFVGSAGHRFDARACVSLVVRPARDNSRVQCAFAVEWGRSNVSFVVLGRHVASDGWYIVGSEVLLPVATGGPRLSGPNQLLAS